MANYVMNIGKGRTAEFFYRVKNNDPANSAIVIVPLSATDTEANRQDDDDLATFLAAAPNEQTAGGWVRKTLTDADLAAVTPDDVNNRFAATVPTITFTAPTAPNNTVAVAVCYDSDTTSGTDSNIIVCCVLDFAVTADGNDVQLVGGDVFRAS
jgi:hypothetical protein